MHRLTILNLGTLITGKKKNTKDTKAKKKKTLA